MKECAEQLGQRRKELLLENPSLDSLAAFNTAVNERIESLKSESPEEWEQFETMAEELRSASKSDYTDLSTEVLKL
jgi:hypothetical protein